MYKIGIKPVIPSLREKKRYLVYEIKTEKKIQLQEVKQEIEDKMLQFLGELGYGKAGIIILNEWQDNKGMLKVNTKYLNNVKTALSLITSIEGQRVLIKSIGVSGILSKAKDKFLKGGR